MLTQIKVWFKRFKYGHTLMEIDQHSGRLQTTQTPAVVVMVKYLVMGDCRLTIQEIVKEGKISKDSAHGILHDDLNMPRVVAKFGTKLL